MTPLLVSKIDDLDIIQIGTAVLTGANKSQDGSKVGAAKEAKIGFVTTSGVNYDIDVGNAKLSHTFEFYLENRIHKDSLHKILFEKKYCVLVDKFKGNMNVFITNVTSIDSDSHVGLTEYRVTCNVQDDLPSPVINFRVKIDEITSIILGGIEPDIALVIKQIKTTQLSFLGSVLKFISEALESLFSSLDGVFAALDVVGQIAGELLAIQAVLIEACQKILSYPNAILDLIDEVIAAKDTAVSSVDGLKATITFTKARLNRNSKLFAKKLTYAQPKIRGQNLSDLDVNSLSQFDKESVALQLGGCIIANKVNLVLRLKDIKSGNFNSKIDFDESVASVLVLAEQIGFTTAQVFQIQAAIKGFANEQSYREVVKVNVIEPQPLLRLVFERYGNIDNYSEIEAINGRADNDKVSGEVYFFQ